VNQIAGKKTSQICVSRCVTAMGGFGSNAGSNIAATSDCSGGESANPLLVKGIVDICISIYRNKNARAEISLKIDQSIPARWKSRISALQKTEFLREA
jgi:hypothetical protein